MSRVCSGLGVIDGHAHASSPAPGNCADGDDADDSAGECGAAGDHRSGLDSSNVAPNWSSRNGGHGRCGVSGSASSLGSSKRSTDHRRNSRSGRNSLASCADDCTVTDGDDACVSESRRRC